MNRERNLKRFSDDKLQEFYVEFLEHQNREVEDRKEMMKCMGESKEAIQKLTESTAGMVQAWEATQGAVKVSVVLGSIIKWTVGVGVATYAMWEFMKHIGK